MAQFASLVLVLIPTAILATLVWWAISYWASPLRRYPGPFLAGWTNIWRLWMVRTGKYPQIIRQLHDKHGPVVRIGPDLLDLDYPELVPTIYGTDNKFLKTSFYDNQAPLVNGCLRPNMFNTKDVALHAWFKRPVAKHYSISASIGLESLMNPVIENLCRQLQIRFAEKREIFDLAEWVKLCAWDVVGMTSLSEDFAFLSHGYDFDGSIKTSVARNDYFVAIGQMPFLDHLFDKNPIIKLGPRVNHPVLAFAMQHIIARKKGQDKNIDPSRPDYLELFLRSNSENPESLTEDLLFGAIVGNLVAGSDTTASAITAALYYAIRDRRVWDKLTCQVQSAHVDPATVFPYSKARALPYVEAVIRESARMFPVIPIILERTVPQSRLELPSGDTIPPGTSVGMNSFVLNRNPDIWGEDVNVFRPERWLPLEGETVDNDAYRERIRRFNRADLQFGGGSRICLGKSFATVETYKVVATLVNRFDIQLQDPNTEWKTVATWFSRQSDVFCSITERMK